MIMGTFPLGALALNPDWPEARFNVSGAITLHGLLLEFIEMARRGFECRPNIESMHGAPSMLWNAGRVSKTPYNPAQLQGIIQELHSENIGFYATFSNHLIEHDDLADPVGNSMLDLLAQRPDLNGVIVASDLLSDYIARRCPALPQVASIIKVTMEHGQGKLDYYRRLGERFHRYVVHPDDCRDPKLLEQLDRQKAEIIANENCVSYCPNRLRHYDNTARLQRLSSMTDRVVLNGLSPMAEQIFVMQERELIRAACQAPLDTPGLAARKRSCNLTRAEMKAAYDLGFRHFKLQGRGGFAYNYIYDLTRFVLEQDFAAPMILKSLCALLAGAAPAPT